MFSKLSDGRADLKNSNSFSRFLRQLNKSCIALFVLVNNIMTQLETIGTNFRDNYVII